MPNFYKTKKIKDFTIQDYITADDILFEHKYKELYANQGTKFEIKKDYENSKIKVLEHLDILTPQYLNRSLNNYIHESILEFLFKTELTQTLKKYIKSNKEKHRHNDEIYIIISPYILQKRVENFNPETEILICKL